MTSPAFHHSRCIWIYLEHRKYGITDSFVFIWSIHVMGLLVLLQVTDPGLNTKHCYSILTEITYKDKCQVHPHSSPSVGSTAGHSSRPESCHGNWEKGNPPAPRLRHRSTQCSLQLHSSLCLMTGLHIRENDPMSDWESCSFKLVRLRNVHELPLSA